MGALNPSQYILEKHLQNQATLQKKAAPFITSLHFTSLSSLASYPSQLRPPCIRVSETTQKCTLTEKETHFFRTSEVVYHFNPISSCLKSHLMACGILSPKFEAFIWMFEGFL